MEGNPGVNYALICSRNAGGPFRNRMEPDVEMEEDSFGMNEITGKSLIQNEGEKLQRLESNGKPKSMEDFLPVLVAVWSKMNPETRSAYKIFREILSDKVKCFIEPFLDAVDSQDFPDYYDIVQEPMDFFKISEKFHEMKYISITEVVADIRQIIENCFKYNGMDSFISKQARKLEVILEQKLNLLSRELRSKTTIAATNKIKNREYLNNLLFTSGGRRQTQKLRNGENSLIATQMHLQEELEGKERKRLKHKEKKEISVALEEECEKWTKEILNDDAFAEISTSWEIPSVGIFICILRDFLNLQDFNFSEFEIGMLFPRSSSLVARIFTSLLVTSFQRKKLNSKDPMKYSVWSEKVKSKLVSWYKIASTHGQEYSASLYGFDAGLFEVLGYVNPFVDSEFHELPLKSRMWALKALCEAALEQDSVLRDYFGELEFMDRQDLCLGFDSEGFSYHYISHFGSTDLRIYKQKAAINPAMPILREQPIMMGKEEHEFNGEPIAKDSGEDERVDNKAKVDAFSNVINDSVDDASNTSVRTSKRIRTKRSLSPPPAKSAPPKREKQIDTTCKAFMVVASDVPSLKVLLDKFESRKKEKGNRRQQEKELQLSLDALYVELKKREATFIKSNQKARMKAMVECKEWEKKEIEKTEDGKKATTGWDSENDEEDFDIEVKSEENLARCDSEAVRNGNEMVENLNAIVNMISSGEAPGDPALTKEGRKLRSKRFNVKELFSDPTQPPSKRIKAEKKKQGSSTPDGSEWATDGQHCYPYEQNDCDRAERRQKRRAASCFRRNKGRDDFISEQEILMLREKRLEKIKKDLREGKVLSVEERRNLMHLGLAPQQIKELISLHDKNPDQTNSGSKPIGDDVGPMDVDAAKVDDSVVKIDGSKLFLSYDGLKALADVASLAQQTSQDGTLSEQKPKQKAKQGNDVVKQSGSAEVSVTVSKTEHAKLATHGNAKLILVGSQKDKGSTNGASVVYVIEDKAKQKTETGKQPLVINKSTCAAATTSTQERIKNIVIEAKSPNVAKQSGAEKDKVLITTNVKTPGISITRSTGSMGNDRPLILQRKRPNILRKSIAVATRADVITSKEARPSLRAPDSIGPSVSTSRRAQDMQPSTVKSTVAAIHVSMPSTDTQSGAVGMGDVKLEPPLVISSQGQVGGRVIGLVDSIVRQNVPISPKQPILHKQQLDINTGKQIVKGHFQNLPGKPTAAGSVVIVTQGSQVIGHNGVPLIIASNTQSLIQGKGHDKNQPVLLLTSKQPMLQQGTFQANQPAKCVVVKRQADSSLLAYDQQCNKSSAVGGYNLTEGGNVPSTNCPVTTLKSKLHAAALKRRLNSKNKADLFQTNYQPISAKTNSPMKSETEISGAVVASNLVASERSGIAVDVPEASCQKTVGIVHPVRPAKMTNQPKIAPKAVHITKSAVPNGLESVQLSRSSKSVDGIELGQVQCLNQNTDEPSSVIGACNQRILVTDVNTIVSSASASGISDQATPIGGMRNYQIVKKLNSPVNSTNAADKAVFFTSWSHAYIPNKPGITNAKQRPFLSVPGTRSPLYQPIKPALATMQGSENLGSATTVPQPTSPVLITPTVFSSYQRTISMPAQIVQLPAQIPSKQEVSGASESNRGVATAAQLVIVPQTRAPKQIRPAIDSTTAVKALKSLEQVMRPVSTVSSLMTLEIGKAIENAKVTVENSPSIVADAEANVTPKGAEVLTGSCISAANEQASSQNETNASIFVLIPNQEVSDASATVKDKSSVTFSTLSPIPCAEIKAPVPNSDPVSARQDDSGIS